MFFHSMSKHLFNACWSRGWGCSNLKKDTERKERKKTFPGTFTVEGRISWTHSGLGTERMWFLIEAQGTAPATWMKSLSLSPKTFLCYVQCKSHHFPESFRNVPDALNSREQHSAPLSPPSAHFHLDGGGEMGTACYSNQCWSLFNSWS